MMTILSRLNKIEADVALLQAEVKKLKEPFAGFIDTTAADQVEDDRNLDHFNDEKI